MTLNITHIYPELLNLFSDRGNIITLKRRCALRGIECNIIPCSIGETLSLENTDILLLGGGGEREQIKALELLLPQKKELSDYAEKGKVMLAMCGGFEILGKTVEYGEREYEGLGILNINTKEGSKKLIGNIVIQSDLISHTVAGFENHLGRIEINDHTAFGKVVKGYGNNTESGLEGVVYKNVIATNIHGPILPKNPKLADHIISCALKAKYGDEFKGALSPIDDSFENMAHDYIVNL